MAIQYTGGVKDCSITTTFRYKGSNMTKNSPVVDHDTTCVRILQLHGFKQFTNSNCWNHLNGMYKVYIFGDAGPMQEWRFHKKSGMSFPVVHRGVGPSDLHTWLQENLT